MKIKAEISVIIDTATLINPQEFDTPEKLADLANLFLFEDIQTALADGAFDELVTWEILPE
jgi:hypothetical protein